MRGHLPCVRGDRTAAPSGADGIERCQKVSSCRRLREATEPDVLESKGMEKILKKKRTQVTLGARSATKDYYHKEKHFFNKPEEFAKGSQYYRNAFPRCGKKKARPLRMTWGRFAVAVVE